MRAAIRKVKVPSVSLVMPVYNEAEVIGKVVKDYYQVIKTLPHAEFHICEDGSTDGTEKVLATLSKKLPIKVHSSRKRKGAVQGFKDSLKQATKEIVFFSDSDGTHDPRDFFKLIKKIDSYDIVIGRKLPRHDPFYRLAISNVFNIVISILFGTKFHDINSGFRLLKRTIVTELLPLTVSPACTMAELTLLALRRGYRVIEVPVNHFERKGGSRAINPKKIPRLALTLISNIVRIRFSKF